MSPGRPGEERAGTGWSRTALPLQPGFAKIQLPKFPETKVPGPGPRLSPDIGPKDSDQRGRPLRRIHPEEGGGACSRPPHSHLGVRNLGERGPQEVRPFAGEGLRWAGGLLPGEREGPGGPGGRNSWAGPAAASLQTALANKSHVKFGKDVVSDRGSVPRFILPRLEGSSAAPHRKSHDQRGELESLSQFQKLICWGGVLRGAGDPSPRP